MKQWIVFYQHIEPVHTLALTDNKDGHAKYVEMQTAGHVDAKYVPIKMAEAAPDLLEALEAVMRLKPLIDYPNNTKEKHIGEAMAISGMLHKVEDAIAKAKGYPTTEF